MNVLVTGGAGFIGSHLVDYLLEEEVSVRVVDNLSTGTLENLRHHRENRKFEFIKADLKDKKICSRIVKDADIVFHFAANPEVKLSTVAPRVHFEENVLATMNLLEAVRQNSQVEKFIFASSSAVYGESGDKPVEEDQQLKPVSVYGASKVACEAFIRSYSELYGLKSASLRYANIIGPRAHFGVIYDFVSRLIQSPRKLKILGDGRQVRSYLYVQDAVKAAVVVCKELRNGHESYNVANTSPLSVKELANIVTRTMGLFDVKYTYDMSYGGLGWKGDIRKIVLDTSKLLSLGWAPSYRDDKAISITAEYLAKSLSYCTASN
jgi:UDP-glucose 4-epimerase